MTKLSAPLILTADGWQQNQTLNIQNGTIVDISDGLEPEAQRLTGPVIPGMVNCHSHAFQRAFAGASEFATGQQDSFWSWRKLMYRFLQQVTPEQAEVIAKQLYIEMLKAGYTRVAEFHYLHHQANGQHYHNIATMAQAICQAANDTGMGLTLLPVLYRYSGFGQQPSNPQQGRFTCDIEDFQRLLQACQALVQQQSNANLGFAPHSLRAAAMVDIQQAVAAVKALNPDAPVHIHIAEQQAEVDACIAATGQRPVAYLLEQGLVDSHWCLIHATHITEAESQGIAQSQAVAGICPTTEANLGDGVFPALTFQQQGGRFAIGSDSHISVSPVQELRWYEYAQRLTRQQRAVLRTDAMPHVGTHLWQQACIGGAQSCGVDTGVIAPGMQADLLVLDSAKLGLFSPEPEHTLDALIFASQENMVKDVMVAGQWQVQDYRHPMEQAVAGEYAQLIRGLVH